MDTKHRTPRLPDSDRTWLSNGADQLLVALRAGLAENNAQADLDAIRPQVEAFSRIFRAVGEARAGQLIAIDCTPADGTRSLLDGAVKGTIACKAFNKSLLATWLGDRPVQESLKKARLGSGWAGAAARGGRPAAA